MSLVSVIIPNYNSVAHIIETLDSVFDQTYKHIEIIVVDDGSTDGSFEYLETVKHPKLKVKKNKGKGACAARNYGFELSSGDLIQYLDADDVLSSDKIEAQVKALKDKNNSIAVCSTKHFYNSINEGVIADEAYLFTTLDTAAFLLNLFGANGTPGMVQTSAWLTDRGLIKIAGPWDETLSKDQDGEFFCRVVSRANQVVYVPNVLNYYRKHILGENIANQKQRTHLESQLRALESKHEELKMLKDTAAFKAAFSLQYKWIAINAYPEFKDLSSKAIQESELLGGSDYLPVLGGKLIETIKSNFGWRCAKSVSYWIHKVK